MLKSKTNMCIFLGKCDSGMAPCLPEDLWCNGYKDCADGSDEQFPMCLAHPCPNYGTPGFGMLSGFY